MMKRYGLLAAGLGALLFLAVGCSGDTTVVPGDRQTAGISVSGAGSAFAEPDVAILTLGVDARRDTVSEAREDAANAMNAMLDALKDGGVEDDDIQTSRFSIQPVYDFSNNRQELIGFTVSNIVTAKIRSIDNTGALVDAAAQAGGDLARVQDLRFTIDDPSALEEEARVAAMAEAQAKAATLAEAGGIDLGAPISISEGGGVRPDILQLAEGAAAFDEDLARTPIQIGELEVVVSVQVVYGVD